MTSEVLILVAQERERQEALKEAGKFSATCADPVSNKLKLAILAEEFGEVARAVLDNDKENLAEELVQVAAVAVAWLEGL